MLSSGVCKGFIYFFLPRPAFCFDMQDYHKLVGMKEVREQGKKGESDSIFFILLPIIQNRNRCPQEFQ